MQNSHAPQSPSSAVRGLSVLQHSSKRRYGLTAEDVCPRLQELEYSILGTVLVVAAEVQAELAAGVKKSFPNLIWCNAGDCQAHGQPPVTFFRQLGALCLYPDLFDDPKIPEDVKERAHRILASCSGGSVGAYGHHLGIKSVIEDIAAFIGRRDGVPALVDNISLTIGATGAMDCVMFALSTDRKGSGRAGILVPFPCYPLYTAQNTRYDNYTISYFLDEERGWGVTKEALEKAVEGVKGQCEPRGLVVINPGNPTGQLLTQQDQRTILEFAHQHSLVVLADEVYQENIYCARPFVSMRKVLMDMGPPFAEEVQLVSMMSISKGYYSECGFRGGYFELLNIAPDVRSLLYKEISTLSATPTIAQVVMAGVVNPPRSSEPSYATFSAERTRILEEMATKARFMSRALNEMPNICCQDIDAAMYAFPKIELPPKAIEEAREKGLEPDVFYAETLLRETGVCVVPGCGFGQLPGTFHVRLTTVPALSKLEEVIRRMKAFQISFLKRYE